MKLVIAWAAACLLTACESVPPPPPPVIDNQPPMMVCAIPAGMTEREAEPAKPLGDYSQRDVGSYITALHQWGSRGWLRVDRIDQRSRECQARALAPNS